MSCTGLVRALLAVALSIPSVVLAQEPEAVVLLHGYGRTERSMRPLVEPLRSAGFAVHSFTYSSLRSTPDELVSWLDERVADCCSGEVKVHFVTHSMGGILVRYWAEERAPRNLGRVVMLAPPNHGSEIADVVKRLRLLQRMTGPTASQLGTGPLSLPNRLPRPAFELGVVAAIDPVNPFGDMFVPTPSDGTVSVASTQLDGMRDFVTVSRSHTFIMRDPLVFEYVVRFLEYGCFFPEEESFSRGSRETP